MLELKEYIFQRDHEEFALGDTLDIKTGLILAALTFLAIQSGELMVPGISCKVAILQTLSIIALAFSGVCVAFELLPRDYDREPVPEAYILWTEQLRSAGCEESAIPQKVAEHRENLARKRIVTNAAINIKKSKAMNSAFWFTMAAFALNLLTLFTRLS